MTQRIMRPHTATSTLLVEDNVLVRDGLARYLRRRGDDVLEAGTIREALVVAEATRLNRCLVDLTLPDGNGLSFVAAVSARWPATKTIILSAYVTTPITVAAIKSGAHDVIAKPISPDRLFERIERTVVPPPKSEVSLREQ